jgi:hypothetical protein
MIPVEGSDRRRLPLYIRHRGCMWAHLPQAGTAETPRQTRPTIPQARGGARRPGWRGRRRPRPHIRPGPPPQRPTTAATGPAPSTSPRFERPAQTRTIHPRYHQHDEGAPVSHDGGTFTISY